MGDRRNHRLLARRSCSRRNSICACNLLGALLIVAIGFLFVTVSSRLTGEVGSSSNPNSGMTVATLLLTCLCLSARRLDRAALFVTALSIGGIVCIAASNGGTTSQDLKTGFLVGSTPKYQQIAILIGTLASCLAIGPISDEVQRVRHGLCSGCAATKISLRRRRITLIPTEFEKMRRPTEARDGSQGSQAGSDTEGVFCCAQDHTRKRAGRTLPGKRRGRAGVPRRSRHQRRLRKAPRWLNACRSSPRRKPR